MIFLLLGRAWPNKVPEYLGMGYDILRGNPLTNKVDEGFKSPIFKFTYQQAKKTDDGKYDVPD
jgi:hypothetical protein